MIFVGITISKTNHGLDRLPFHVQGFLLDRWAALFEVLDGLGGGEGAQTAEALVAGVFGDAGQGLFVVGVVSPNPIKFR